MRTPWPPTPGTRTGSGRTGSGWPLFTSSARSWSDSGGTTASAWRPAAWAAVGPPKGHPGEVLCAGLSPDGTRLVTGGKDEAARVWTVDGTEGEPLTLSHTDEVNWVGFSPDGSRVLTAGTDRRVV